MKRNNEQKRPINILYQAVLAIAYTADASSIIPTPEDRLVRIGELCNEALREVKSERIKIFPPS